MPDTWGNVSSEFWVQFNCVSVSKHENRSTDAHAREYRAVDADVVSQPLEIAQNCACAVRSGLFENRANFCTPTRKGVFVFCIRSCLFLKTRKINKNKTDRKHVFVQKNEQCVINGD